MKIMKKLFIILATAICSFSLKAELGIEKVFTNRVATIQDIQELNDSQIKFVNATVDSIIERFNRTEEGRHMLHGRKILQKPISITTNIAYRVVNGLTNKVVLVEYAKQTTYEDGYVHEQWFRKKHVERPKTPMKRNGGLKSKFSARRKKIEEKTEENKSAKPIEKTIIFTP